jgi:polysaccharide chain length determinant protein (PEP-CTERM system associated)
MDGGDEVRHNEPRFVSFWVGFEASDPKLARDMANRLAELFIKQASDAREQRVQDVSRFIQAEISPLQEKLEAQSRRIREYKAGAANALPEQASANLRLLETLQTQYSSKTEEIAKDEARRAAIAQELQELEKQGALETTAPKQEKSDTEKRLDELRIQYGQFQTRYAPDHPELKRVKKEIAELEALVPQTPVRPRVEHSPFYLRYVQLKTELEEIASRAHSYKQEEERLLNQMAAYRSRIESAPVHESELAGIMREYTATQTQYQEMLEKQHNASLAERFEKLGREVVFRIVDPARLPLEPFSPQRDRIILLGIFAGLGLGIALAFFAEQMDTSFESIDDYQKTCDLPLLATVPSIPARPAKATAVHPAIVTLSDPQSIPAEQYQILAMKLQLRHEGSTRVVAITSAAGGEGKTATAVNLALALSTRTDRRTLLVDADLRRPRVHEFLGFKNDEKGFADLLASAGEDTEEYIHKVEGLSVIPGFAPCKNPMALLGSQRAEEVLRTLRQGFDFIILDCPPILPIADSLILSKLADEVFLVLRARQTPREVFQRAVQSLDARNLVGVILNDVAIKHSRYAYAYRYYRKNYLAQQ